MSFYLIGTSSTKEEELLYILKRLKGYIHEQQQIKNVPKIKIIDISINSDWKISEKLNAECDMYIDRNSFNIELKDQSNVDKSILMNQMGRELLNFLMDEQNEK